MPPLRIVDSIIELGTSAEGCLAVSGSHGGLSSVRYTLAPRPLLSILNDTVVGKDSVGLAALDFLQSRRLAAWPPARRRMTTRAVATRRAQWLAISSAT